MPDLKLGLLPPRPERPRMEFHELFPRGLPQPPASWDATQGIKDWGMLGNATAGCCVISEWLHQCMVYETIATGKTPTFTDAEALTLYAQLTGWDPSKPDSDTGLNSEDFLTLATQRTLLGQRLKTFAPVHIRTVEHLKVAIWLFDGLNTGAVLPGDAQEQFEDERPWELTGNTQPLGGHAIPALKYDKDGPVYVTWGREQLATWDWTMQTLMTCDVLIPTAFEALHKALDNGYEPRELDAFLGHV